MTNNTKTLIGKEDYLFLVNDSGRELEIHCNNLDVIHDKTLGRYKHDKFLIVVFPNKSLQYKQYLPDTYDVQYRPGIEVYRSKFQDRMLDTYDFLQDQPGIFYKTDTHMNLKGTLEVYRQFIDAANALYALGLEPLPDIELEKKTCELSPLNYGIGDLTWGPNLGDQILESKDDTYYYSDKVSDFYLRYKVTDAPDKRFLDKDLEDHTRSLASKSQIVDFDILGNYVIHVCTNTSSPKILVFYDSFLLNTLSLYLALFENAYFTKDVYNQSIIDKVKPDYIFEFRVERFLF